MELIAALAGATVGALLTLVGGYFQQKTLETSRAKAQVSAERLSFVREVMRNRFNYPALAAILNEVPLLFGDDVTAINLYRKTVEATGTDVLTRHLVDLIIHLARNVGLSKEVRASDIQRGLVTGDS